MSHQPPRILLLVENNPYPADFRVRREAEALQAAGCHVSVIAPRGAGERWRERVGRVQVHRFPPAPGGRGALGYALEFGWATLAMLAIALGVAVRRGVDVVHAANPPDTLWLIGAVFKLLGRRFVFDQHDLAPEVYRARFERRGEDALYRVLRALEGCSLRLADVVIAPNESYRRLAIARGKDPSRVFVVRNGPPLSFRPLPQDVTLLAGARFLIGYVGTIGPQDGLDRWMRALRCLVFDIGRADVRSLVIGDGDALNAVKALAQTLGVAPYVEFAGRLPEHEVRRRLSSADVCVQPDPSGPLNDHSTMNKLMEYMALGKPTVAFDLHETRESAQEAALYVVPNDETAFAAAVARLLDDPPLREQLGRVGMQRVAERLAWEHSVPHLLAAYRDGLGLRFEGEPSMARSASRAISP